MKVRDTLIYELTQLYKISEGPKLCKAIRDYSTFDIDWILNVLKRKGSDYRLTNLSFNEDGTIVNLNIENISTNETESISLIIDRQVGIPQPK